MSTRIKKSIIEKLLSIGVSTVASIKLGVAKEVFGEDFQDILDDGALEQIGNLNDIEIYEDDQPITVEIEWKDGKNQYFSPSDGWVAVESDEIILYKVSFDWLVRKIMDALGIASHHTPTVIVENTIWFLGQHWIEKKKVPIIIVRNIDRNETYGLLEQYLEQNHGGRDPALTLSLDKNVPRYLQLPGQSRLVRLEEAILVEDDNFQLNTQLLTIRMGGSVNQKGFSSGYRVLVSNGKTYNFTKKQSEAVEYLDNAGSPRHQDEILAEINSSQTRLLPIFRVGGKTNEAWGIIIKHDGKGNYWLEY